ncbi:MAG: alanine racemase [Bacteroidales bacterium]|nr:alanine racemase [Bacteroidales bacterium]
METAKITGPQLMIDRKKCLANIEHISGKARDNNVVFRPHFKTHQSLTIGRWFREYGVDRITVSSLQMAAYFARDGWKDILVGIAYNPREYSLYEELSARCRLLATVSCPETARILAAQCRFPLEVMIKTDTGYNRTGIRWDDEQGLNETIKYLSTNSSLKIRGLMTHDGSTYGMNSRKEIVEQHARTVKRIMHCRDKAGINGLTISLGDTPSASLADNFRGIDEIRPGNFVFYDLMQYFIGSCSFENIALALLCPVIDIRPGAETLVVHGGAVHLSKDSIIRDKRHVYGMLAPIDEAGWHEPQEKIYVTSLSQEHGIIECTDKKLLQNTRPGDLLAIIPVHSCLTSHCMGSYILDNGDYVDHMRHEHR